MAAPAPGPVLEPTEPQFTASTPGPAGSGGPVTVGVQNVADGQQVTFGAPDRPGLFSRCAGVLALNQLDVRAASISVEDGRATCIFAVRPRFGRAPVPEILADGLRAALEGTLPLAERLRQREADYRQDVARSPAPRVSWHAAEVAGAASRIVEVRAGDRAGLLYQLTTALTDEGLDVTSARIETLGADALDSFYVCDPTGTAMDPERRRRVEVALTAAARGVAAEPATDGKPDTPG
jgi:[protein-PII] uridylyltransferase